MATATKPKSAQSESTGADTQNATEQSAVTPNDMYEVNPEHAQYRLDAIKQTRQVNIDALPAGSEKRKLLEAELERDLEIVKAGVSSFPEQDRETVVREDEARKGS